MKHLIAALALLIVPAVSYLSINLYPNGGGGFLLIGIIFFVTPFIIGYLLFAIGYVVFNSIKPKSALFGATQAQSSTAFSYIFWGSLATIIYLLVGVFTENEFLPDPFDTGNVLQSGLLTFCVIGFLIPVCIYAGKKR